MNKKQFSLSKFRKISYSILGILVLVIIFTSIFPIKINISEETIQNKIMKKMPITIDKSFKVPIIKKEINYSISVDNVNVSFKKGKVFINSKGILTNNNNNKFVHFTIISSGLPVYNSDKSSFFFQTSKENLVIDFNDEEIVQMFKPKFLNSFMFSDKIKNSISSNIENYLISSSVIFLNNFAVYNLNKSDKNGSLKMLLSDVKITDKNLILELTSFNILKHSIGFIIVGLFLFIFIIIVTYRVERREKFSFFDLFEIVVEVGFESVLVTTKGVGTVASATLEGVGN